ncbi:hypothetical protein Agub_g15895, partial [Astrephomene gubernaculifera]
ITSLSYDKRHLPVSWLLQCFGPVCDALGWLWPQRQLLRAHVLAAAAQAFATHHVTRYQQPPPAQCRRAADVSNNNSSGSTHAPPLLLLSYIPGSPVVRFVHDCLAATPPHERLQLLEAAMRLNSAAGTAVSAAASAGSPGCMAEEEQAGTGKEQAGRQEVADEGVG